MIYEVSSAQFGEAVIKTLEYYNDGDEIHVTNKRTGETQVYTVETKKVLTKKENWNEKGTHSF